VVVSERDKRALMGLSDRIKAGVLPSGVDCGFFKASQKRLKKDILVFTGVMNTWSNIDAVTFFVKEIFPVIKEKIPSVKFYIVGKRPAASVKKLASENIVVTGEVPDIRPYFDEAAVFVAPFRIGTGLKHKTLEAMAMGVPVVSTTLGANGIQVKSGEDIILADIPREFAEACIKLFNDNQLQDKIVKNAHALVKEKYNWEHIGGKMEDILRGL
jgi:glycosyltransferase involved in cell wall biosynthesis